METWNRLKVTSGEGEGGKLWKEGEGTSQRTCMNDLWMWTTGWGLTVGVGERVGWAGGSNGKKLGQL